jgi:glycosyltransferase 2 family protein
VTAAGSKPRSLERGERLRIGAGLLVSLLALAGIVAWASEQPPPSLPTGTDSLALLAACLVALTASMLLRGFRWSVILRRAGITTARIEPYALTVVGYMGNTVLPVRGGEIVRVALLKDRSDASWPGAIGSIVPERALDVFTLVLMLAALVLGGVIETPGGTTPVTVALAGVASAALLVFLYRALRRRGRLARPARKLAPLLRASRTLLTRTGAWLALLSVGVWLLDGTLFFLVARSLSLDVDPLQALGLAVSAAAFSAIPAGPAFAGTYDAAILFGLGALDVPSGAALSFVIVVRFVAFAPILVVGLVVLVVRYGGLSRLREVARMRGREAAAVTSASEGPAGELAAGPADAGQRVQSDSTTSGTLRQNTRR